MDADVIVVGAGLAGLVATAELADAGRTVLLLDQEPEQSLGGQAFWSLGGLFLVDSPEQRRMGVKDSYELALQDWMGSAQFDRERTTGRAAGPRRTSTSPPARSGRGCTTRACGSSRSSAGPSAATAARTGTATRCRASTSPGAPAPASSRPSSVGSASTSRPGLVTLGFRHRVDELVTTDGAVTGVRGAVLEPDDAERGARLQPRRRSTTSSYTAQAVVVTSGGIGGNHDLVRAQLAGDRLGPPPKRMIVGRPRPRRRPDARDHAGRRRRDHQPRPDVALHRGHPQLGPDLGQARHPDPARPVVAVARRDRRALPRAVLPRLRHARHAGRDRAHGLRLLVVRAHPEDHREGVRALGLRAEPRPHRQGHQAAALARARPARPGRSRRSSSTARTSSSPPTCPSWSPA